jgi:hypothetical protein
MALSGALTLDAHGDADAIFVFQTVSTLNMGTTSHITLTGGAQACNVFWKVGSTATLGTDAVFVGNILAMTDITLSARAKVEGRLLARSGEVTLIENTITRPSCTTGSGGSGGSAGGSGSGGSGTNGAGQVRRVPKGSVDAGDGSSLLGRTPDCWQ